MQNFIGWYWVNDIWSKTISSTGHFVEYDNTSMRRIVEYDNSLATTIRRNFVEKYRNFVDI